MSGGSKWPSSAGHSGGLQTPMPQSLCTWSNQVPPCFPMAIQLQGLPAVAEAVCSLGPHSAVTQRRTPAWSSAFLFAFVSFTPTWWISPLAQHLGPLLLPHPPHWHWPEWIRRSGVMETVSSCGNPGKMTCEHQVQKRGNTLASGELEANGLIRCPLPCRPSPEERWAVCPGAGHVPVCDAA